MKWKKLGRIYQVENENPFLVTHASNPLAVHLKDDVFRIYYTGRNVENQSSVSYVDYDMGINQIIYDHKKPIVEHGEPSSFYSHGVSVGNMWEQDGKNFIGFMGWQVPENSHWRGDIGKFDVATGQVSFLMGTSIEDKVSLSYPFILKEDSLYKMWYGSTLKWTSENGEMIHVIKYATSKDGNLWDHHGIAIPYKIGEAQAFSRPSVLKINNTYHMWYSFRSGSGEKYRIGYASSFDGVNWNRQRKNFGIDVGEENSWDSEMVCYPYVFKHKNEIYMIYNGNSYGKTGFGLAKLASF